MKRIITLFLPFVLLSVNAQDTINNYRLYDGTRTFQILGKTDTTEVRLYPNGKKESVCPFVRWERSGTYKRWYDNGKPMCVKELKNGMAEGKTTLYNTKGVKIAEFTYVQGKLTDTLFLAPGIHLVLGHLTFSSRVVGGAVRPDGSSNVSESSGPMQYYSMYAAKVDSLTKPVLIQNFMSDFLGDFFVVVPKGEVSFFPKSMPPEKLQPGQRVPGTQRYNSCVESWDFDKPISVKEQKIIFVSIHQRGEGYAP